jgi:hypothetical protein
MGGLTPQADRRPGAGDGVQVGEILRGPRAEGFGERGSRQRLRRFAK